MSGSLGFATDLALRAAEGARIERTSGAITLRMAKNPAFRWGNFLLVTKAGDPAARIAEHAATFPAAGFVTIGIDDPDPVFDGTLWLQAGFAIERLVVLMTDQAPSAPDTGVRPLESDADWDAETALSFSLEADGDAAHLLFSQRRTAERRAAVTLGRMVWLGVEHDGRIVATAGIGDAGDGIARFQDVQTDADHRRRGHASALIAVGARTAADAFGSRRFVLVAEADGPAIGLYRRLGFRDVEAQVQLSRVDPTVGAAS